MNTVSYYVAPAIIGKISKDAIIDLVCLQYSVTFDQLKSHSRKQELTFPRHLCMYLIYKYAKLPLNHVGRIFERDHTTVIYAKQMIENYIFTDHQHKKTINILAKRCEQRIL